MLPELPRTFVGSGTVGDFSFPSICSFGDACDVDSGMSSREWGATFILGFGKMYCASTLPSAPGAPSNREARPVRTYTWGQQGREGHPVLAAGHRNVVAWKSGWHLPSSCLHLPNILWSYQMQALQGGAPSLNDFSPPTRSLWRTMRTVFAGQCTASPPSLGLKSRVHPKSRASVHGEVHREARVKIRHHR